MKNPSLKDVNSSCKHPVDTDVCLNLHQRNGSYAIIKDGHTCKKRCLYKMLLSFLSGADFLNLPKTVPRFYAHGFIDPIKSAM